MRKGAIEMEKIIVWAIGVLLALVFIWFIATQLSPGNDGGLVNQSIDRISNPLG